MHPSPRIGSTVPTTMRHRREILLFLTFILAVLSRASTSTATVQQPVELGGLSLVSEITSGALDTDRPVTGVLDEDGNLVEVVRTRVGCGPDLDHCLILLRPDGGRAILPSLEVPVLAAHREGVIQYGPADDGETTRIVWLDDEGRPRGEPRIEPLGRSSRIAVSPDGWSLFVGTGVPWGYPHAPEPEAPVARSLALFAPDGESRSGPRTLPEGELRGLAVAPRGQWYALAQQDPEGTASSSAHRVRVFDRDGRLLREEAVSRVQRLAPVDRGRFLWVQGRDDHRLLGLGRGSRGARGWRSERRRCLLSDGSVGVDRGGRVLFLLETDCTLACKAARAPVRLVALDLESGRELGGLDLEEADPMERATILEVEAPRRRSDGRVELELADRRWQVAWSFGTGELPEPTPAAASCVRELSPEATAFRAPLEPLEVLHTLGTPTSGGLHLGLDLLGAGREVAAPVSGHFEQREDRCSGVAATLLPLGHRKHRFSHLEPNVNCSGCTVEAGDRIGRIPDICGGHGGWEHLHWDVYESPPTRFLDALALLDEDPGNRPPELRSLEAVDAAPGDRQPLPLSLGALRGRVELVAKVADDMHPQLDPSGAVAPYALGYWIESLDALSGEPSPAIAGPEAPNWLFCADRVPALSGSHALVEEDRWEEVLDLPWTRNLTWVLTHAADRRAFELPCPETTRASAARYWNTLAPNDCGSGCEIDGSPVPGRGSAVVEPAGSNAEALFPDGRYRLHLRFPDRRHPDAGTFRDLVVDNWQPRVVELTVSTPSGLPLGVLEPDCTSAAPTIEVASTDADELLVEVRFTEAMAEASLLAPDGSWRVGSPAPGGRAWRWTLPADLGALDGLDGLDRLELRARDHRGNGLPSPSDWCSARASGHETANPDAVRKLGVQRAADPRSPS